MIYLDYAANTPVDKRVLDKFNEITLKYCGYFIIPVAWFHLYCL